MFNITYSLILNDETLNKLNYSNIQYIKKITLLTHQNIYQFRYLGKHSLL